jgi:hypothetical protein
MTKPENAPAAAVGSPFERPVGRPVPERVTLACLLVQQNFKPGDQAPQGYLAWHEWAEVQHKAGLRQKQCGRCGLWRYPQQLSAEVDRAELVMTKKRKSRRVTVETPVCNDCHKPPNVGAKLETTAPAQN